MRLFFTLSFFVFSNQLFANEITQGISYIRSQLDLNVNFSGGMGQLKNAKDHTGESGVLRFGLGSMWHLNDKTQLGTELGFQTGSQMVLNPSSTEVLGPNALPVFLIMKSPIDGLLTARYYAYDPIFLSVKGGYVYQGTMVNGADVTTTNQWLPEVQGGIGIKLASQCRFLINYQRFFGETPMLRDMDVVTGISKLHGIPTWQAVFLSIELNV